MSPQSKGRKQPRSHSNTPPKSVSSQRTLPRQYSTISALHVDSQKKISSLNATPKKSKNSSREGISKIKTPENHATIARDNGFKTIRNNFVRENRSNNTNEKTSFPTRDIDPYNRRFNIETTKSLNHGNLGKPVIDIDVPRIDSKPQAQWLNNHQLMSNTYGFSERSLDNYQEKKTFLNKDESFKRNLLYDFNDNEEESPPRKGVSLILK